MSGKFVVAVLLAASSASAATVGVVFSRLAMPHHEAVATLAEGGGAPSGPVKSAVVLDASESLFEPVAEASTDSRAPVCPASGESRGCILVMRASDVRLKILGYTLSIPPLWLGGNSEDAYDSRDPWLWRDPPEVKFLFRAGHRHGQSAGDGATSDDDTGQGAETSSDNSDSQGQSRDDLTIELTTPAAMAQNFAFPARLMRDRTAGAVDPPIVPVPEFTDPIVPRNALPPPITLVQQPNVPEPSTWLMMILGLASLGWLGRRRIASGSARAMR